MPFQVRWYIEKQVVYVRFWGELTVEDLRAEVEQGLHYVEISDRPLVHIIIDASKVTKNLNLRELGSVMSGRKSHPRGGWTIMVGEQDILMRFLASVGRQLLKLRQRSCDTFAQAVDFLKEVDTSIDWETADNTVLDFQPDSKNQESKAKV